MSDIKDQAQGFMEKIKARYRKELEIISKKTGIDGKYISLGLLISAILCFVNLFSKYITCLVGVTLPAYWSMKAIESQEYDEVRQWLTYWAIYGLFTFLDQFANIILRIFPGIGSLGIFPYTVASRLSLIKRKSGRSL